MAASSPVNIAAVAAGDASELAKLAEQGTFKWFLIAFTAAVVNLRKLADAIGAERKKTAEETGRADQPPT